ncbi:MAG: DUF6273 domain-containing protein [Saccharofermentans sp.]|nr:DUF6273 domain-containing protein [Saccharofermentans sp.]
MKKILAVMLTAAIVLTACCSCGSHEDAETEPAGPVRHGNYITFGHYEQDEDESNGPEPVDWIILSEEDGRMLVISRYILDWQPYNTEMTDVTWETCSIRKWLNEDFINAAFSASEQEQILTVTNTNPGNENPWGIADGGNDTEDKIFLLSSDEADLYFDNDDERAVDKCDWWWLRSPGYINNRASVVLTIGEIYRHGHIVSFNHHDHGVRPAFWLEIET